jgi:hypothetical protein
VRKRLSLVVFAVAAVVLVVAWFRLARAPFPADTTPEGAYLRIVLAVDANKPADFFAYLETDAQWAAYTIRDARAKACARVRESYPEADRAPLLAAYGDEASAPDGADVVALMAARRGWLARLRKDTSGVKKVEIEGERATVVTARGTRYPFRKRDNGMWGLTIFTAELLVEAERASRDLAVVEAAADDYARVRDGGP